METPQKTAEQSELRTTHELATELLHLMETEEATVLVNRDGVVMRAETISEPSNGKGVMLQFRAWDHEAYLDRVKRWPPLPLDSEPEKKLAKNLTGSVVINERQDALAVLRDLNAKPLKRVRQEGVEPMSIKTSNNAENVAPIFEGALDRETMAEALNAVMERKDLSVRKAAAELGINKDSIERIKAGQATLDKAAEVLEGLGCRLNVSIVPVGP